MAPRHQRPLSLSLYSQVEALLEPWLFEWVVAARGSVSAEHGVGRCKSKYLALTHSADVLAAMAQVYTPLLNRHASLEAYFYFSLFTLWH